MSSLLNNFQRQLNLSIQDSFDFIDISKSYCSPKSKGNSGKLYFSISSYFKNNLNVDKQKSKAFLKNPIDSLLESVK